MRMRGWLVVSALVVAAGCPAPPQNVVQVCTTTCPTGMVCAPMDGTTLEVCVYEANGVRCAPGEVLLDGACVASQRRGRACSASAACGPGYECVDDPQQAGAHVCWPRLTDIAGTVDGQVYVCTPDEKPLGAPPSLCLATCQGAICAADEACAKTVAGDACAALDPLGRACGDDSHCAATSDRVDPPLPAYYCAQGRCLPRMVACAGDVDCPAGFACDATHVCVERPPEPPPTFTYCRDADEDGYCIDDGCQVMAAPGPASPPRWRADCGVFERASCDAQAGANPGVDEVCNGLDDDCDGVVDDGLTCAPPEVECDHRTPPLAWQCKRHAQPVGRPPRERCIAIREPADDERAVWDDNSLCGPAALALQWSSAGPIAGKQCVRVYEDAEAANETWNDNYLCWRNSAWQRPGTKLTVRWSQAGPIADMDCLQWDEPGDPDAWSDNYLCWSLTAIHVPRRPCHCLDGMCTDATPASLCRRVCAAHGADSGHTHDPCE